MSAIVAFFLENSKCILTNLKFFGIILGVVAALCIIKSNISLKVQNELLNKEIEEENKALKVQNEIMEVAEEHEDTDGSGIVKLMHKDKL